MSLSYLLGNWVVLSTSVQGRATFLVSPEALYSYEGGTLSMPPLNDSIKGVHVCFNKKNPQFWMCTTVQKDMIWLSLWHSLDQVKLWMMITATGTAYISVRAELFYRMLMYLVSFMTMWSFIRWLSWLQPARLVWIIQRKVLNLLGVRRRVIHLMSFCLSCFPTPSFLSTRGVEGARGEERKGERHEKTYKQWLSSSEVRSWAATPLRTHLPSSERL